jgi:hypothetical protein
MKIQLDTTNKTIKVEDNVKFSELIKVLEKILPKGEWKEFILETNVTITYWHEPIYIWTSPRADNTNRDPYPYPWYVRDTSATYLANNTNQVDYKLQAGTFNIEY